MTDFTRFAVYYAPPPGAFATCTAQWLGWDAARGEPVTQPEVPGLDVAAITEAPRKYGFHGTLKPPFRLADGANRAVLEVELSALAARIAPVRCEGLALARLGGFFALTPVGDGSALKALAARVVRDLDPLRAPPGKAELDRRRATGLTPAQEVNLITWGYPYVMNAFQFHLTLTGKLPEGLAVHVESILAERLRPVLPTPFEVNDLCLFGEREDGRFHLLHRYTLSG